MEGETLNPTHDEWSSFDTYGSPADCKNQVQSHLILLEKSYQESKTLLEDYRLTIEREKQGLTVTGVPVKKSGDAKAITTTRFFCLPLGQDPRPKIR